MKNIVSHFLLLVFLILIMWIGVAYVLQNIQYSSAKSFHSGVIEQIENSYYRSDVIEECKKRAEANGYQLRVEEYSNPSGKDARVILEFSYTMPVIQVTRTYSVEGYTR